MLPPSFTLVIQEPSYPWPQVCLCDTVRTIVRLLVIHPALLPRVLGGTCLATVRSDAACAPSATTDIFSPGNDSSGPSVINVSLQPLAEVCCQTRSIACHSGSRFAVGWIPSRAFAIALVGLLILIAKRAQALDEDRLPKISINSPNLRNPMIEKWTYCFLPIPSIPPPLRISTQDVPIDCDCPKKIIRLSHCQRAEGAMRPSRPRKANAAPICCVMG